MGTCHETFDQLWDDCAPAVAAYVGRRASGDTVDDVVVETFLVAWRRIDHVPANQLPWLYGVARRVLANQRRTEDRRSKLAERLSHVESSARSEVSADSLVLEALALLRRRDQELLMLVAWEGLSPAEVAVALGSSATATRIRLHRARQRLAAALAEVESGALLREPIPKEAR